MRTLDLAIGLYDKYASLAEVKHYYGIMAIYGFCRVAEASGDPALMRRAKEILGRFPDRIEHSQYNFENYRIGGLARAYMVFRGHDPAARGLVRDAAEQLMNAARDPRGIFKHPRRVAEELIWIDVAMAVTPFLLWAGLTFDTPRYIDEAAQQTFLMIEEFGNPENGLLHQCKNFRGAGKLSDDHWSRGNAWGYFALTELVQYLPADSPHRPRAIEMFSDLSEALRVYQNDRGLWRQEIPLAESWEESSGTGLFLYGYGVGMTAGVLDRGRYRPAFDRGIEGLVRHCIAPDLTTLHCCKGCLCPGKGDRHGTVAAYLEDVHPVPNDGHSFGPFMLALEQAHALGILTVDR